MPQFGHIGTYLPGDTFRSRLELRLSGMHRPVRAGIAGSQHTGAESIVMSQVYEDDVFTDDEIIYTGQGGRDPKSGHQVSDQVLNDRNLALVKSAETGLPVRVFRKVLDELSSELVFRYEGLYRVAGHAFETGKSGKGVWRFRLVPFQA
ncbi:YDG/SRA domain-containing protein [Hymenobacter latericus]|uniref:YDG/SRA domain-containing protein n=1 Tax=Hymenobacter sp. YIM 151858-1 TaxID=2987688 RepID=UPI002227DF71|nr:YDG/SRA domain-containing protein [Hymenobacter sp. YIM 151858-1]UYZ59120.1 YDG/SRA domain-containing protein [Hymenobacter sp. YIM 151858-1]